MFNALATNSYMARNHKFFFDSDRIPRARGPAAEAVLMTFLESDVQGSDHICHDLMEDLIAIEEGADTEREFIGNAHRVTLTSAGVVIETLALDSSMASEDDVGENVVGENISVNRTTERHGVEGEPPDANAPDVPSGSRAVATKTAIPYSTGLKHFREILEDWEAFILDDDFEDDTLDESYE